MSRSLIAATLMLLTPLAMAQVYKWTDSQGIVHYSQTAPATGVDFKKITTAASNAAATPEPAQESQPAPARTQAAAAASQPIADTPANRKTLCDSLQANLTMLKGTGPVVLQQDGKSTALDDTQRRQQITADEAQYEQYCQAE
jgi:predicted flap endonuclease-1-like 5' DNA nuclease